MKLLKLNFSLFGFLIVCLACNNKTSNPKPNTIQVESPQKLEIFPISNQLCPTEIKFQGKLDSIFKWKDKTGEYICIQTSTGIVSDTLDNGSSSGDLYTYCFKFDIAKKQYSRIWHLHDFVNNCPTDIEVEFLPNTFQITDLNKNEIPEIWTMYKTVCHGDVSPSEMKIICYEGMKKMAMRGRNRVKVSKTETDGGEYVLDKAFQLSDPAIIKHARNLWNTHIDQVWD
jgi:hypothetical protein